MRQSFISQNPSVLWFLSALALFTIGVTVLSEAAGIGLVSTSFVKTLGKTLCLCLIAIAMDVVWGYCGILSLGHFAFFGIGGYAIGMWLMYARTESIVLESLSGQPIPAASDRTVTPMVNSASAERNHSTDGFCEMKDCLILRGPVAARCRS